MKTKLRAIGALVGRRFFLSFCYCFRFWFFFSFNSCLHSSSSSSMLSPGLLCVSLQEPLLEDEDVDEGGLVNQCSPLLLFLLMFTCSGHRFSLCLYVLLLFLLSLLDSLYTLFVYSFFLCVFFQSVLLLALLCPFFFRLWPSLTFYKAKGWPLFMCSCLTNASVSLRKNRGQLRRRSWETWPKTVLVSCWIGPWSGDEKGDEQWFKRRRSYSWKWLFSTWPLHLCHLTIGSLINENQFLILPLDQLQLDR